MEKEKLVIPSQSIVFLKGNDKHSVTVHWLVGKPLVIPMPVLMEIISKLEFEAVEYKDYFKASSFKETGV